MDKMHEKGRHPRRLRLLSLFIFWPNYQHEYQHQPTGRKTVFKILGLFSLLIFFIFLMFEYEFESENLSSLHKISKLPPPFLTAAVNFVKSITIQGENDEEKQIKNKMDIYIAAVVCGNLDYLKVMVKTSLIFSQDAGSLNFIFFADEETKPNLRQFMINLGDEQKSLRGKVQMNFTYELHDIWFPDSAMDVKTDWRNMYLPCTNQRLFFPSLLPHIDSLIYLDTDTIILGNLSEVWNEFSRMNSDKIIAMAPDFDYSYPGWRNFQKYVNISGENGVNAGVSLMNLTRLRAFGFEQKIKQVVEEHRSEIIFADQDMMNILFNEHPKQIHVLSCIFNFFVPRCTKKAWCKDIAEKGIYIVHGAGGYFQAVHPSKPIVWSFENNDDILGSPAFFSWIYNVTRDFKLGESPLKLQDQLVDEYQKNASLSCYGNGPEILTRNMQLYLNNLNLNVDSGIQKNRNELNKK